MIAEDQDREKSLTFIRVDLCERNDYDEGDEQNDAAKGVACGTTQSEKWINYVHREAQNLAIFF